MQTAETVRAKKALSGLLGFLARGVVREEAAARKGVVELCRDDGVRRKADLRLLTLARSRGLIAFDEACDAARVCALTSAGRAALRRALSDPDSAFQDQHRSLVQQRDPDHGAITVNLEESPLTALARLKGRNGVSFLEACHVEAGERLRRDFTRGQLQPSLSQNWRPVRLARQPGAAGGTAELGEAALSARIRVERALAEVGPELSGVLVDVCCFLKRLSDVERERQWPVRSAKLMLRTALAALVRHYDGPRKAQQPGLSQPPARPPHAP